MINALILEEIMWKSRLKCELLCKNEIVTIFLLVFLYLKTVQNTPCINDVWINF